MMCFSQAQRSKHAILSRPRKAGHGGLLELTEPFAAVAARAAAALQVLTDIDSGSLLCRAVSVLNVSYFAVIFEGRRREGRTQ